MLDPRLAADTHAVGDLPLSRLLLMDDARYPWLILVPRIAGAREWIDLDSNDRSALSDEISTVGRALEAWQQPDKLNIATLGNVVAQLHIHVIARKTTDAVWPKPVWGHGERIAYTAADAAVCVGDIRRALQNLLE